MGRAWVVVLGAPLLTGCLSSSSTTGSDCVSSYEQIVEGSSRAEVKDALVTDVPRARSIRVQGHNDDKTTVDVLDRKGRRLMQVDVLERDDGTWMAGRWQQCID